MTTKTWPDSHPLKKTTYYHKNKWQQKHGQIHIHTKRPHTITKINDNKKMTKLTIFVRVCGLFEWMWIWPCFCCHLFLWEYVVFLSGCESGHVFVVIYFCESTWSFWVDVNLAKWLQKHGQIHIHSKRPHTLTKINDNKNMARFTTNQKDHILSQK
jgi:hypothetical protein